MDIDKLKSISHLLLWLTVLLPVLGGLAAAARYYVDRRVSTLSSEAQEAKLSEATSSLRVELSASEVQHQAERKKFEAELNGARKEVKALKEAADPRSLSADQRSLLKSRLAECPQESRAVRFAFLNGNVESYGFAKLLADVFREAGWRVTGPSNTITVNVFPGVVLRVKSSAEPAHCAGLVQQALREIGMEVAGEIHPDLDGTTVDLVVGHK